MKCPHAIYEEARYVVCGHPDKKQLHGEMPSPGTCRDNCKNNPSPGVWPVRLTISATPATAYLASNEAIAARIAKCTPCDANKGIRDMRPRFMSVTVKCADCTTCEGGRALSAASQHCPRGEW